MVVKYNNMDFNLDQFVKFSALIISSIDCKIDEKENIV
jgi:hypothetical protein